MAPKPPTLDQLLREFRRTILGIDQALAANLVREFRQRAATLGADLAAVTDAVRRADEIADAARWIRESDAAGRLLAAAEAGMADFGTYAANAIEERRQQLISLALEHDEKLTYASIVGGETITPGTANAIRAAFTAIPVEAVSATVGALQPSSPLRTLFDEFGEQASRQLGERLVDGITRGEGAEQIARGLRESLDGNAARALTVARTETHRAYRSSSLERYRANPRVYAGWTWHANLDRRTCPVCVAKHGSEHALDEDFGSHPNCRCRPLPMTRSLVDILGDSPDARELQANVDAARTARPTGPQWFAKQPVDVQRGILGPVKYDALKRGEITLADAVVERVDPAWGLGHRTASLREATRNANARRAS